MKFDIPQLHLGGGGGNDDEIAAADISRSGSTDDEEVSVADASSDLTPNPGDNNSEGKGGDTRNFSRTSGWRPGSGGGSQVRGNSRGSSAFNFNRSGGSRISGSKVGGINLGGVSEAKKNSIEGSRTHPSYMTFLNRCNRGRPGGMEGRHESENGRRGGSPVRASSGSGGLPGGDSGGSFSAETGKKKKSFLSKLASKVGLGRYFGGGGSQSGNFYRRKTYNRGKKLKIASKKNSGERLKSPADILRERFNRNMRRRNLANSPEFGSSRTSLFRSICEQYDNYAASHNIPDNRKHCPRD